MNRKKLSHSVGLGLCLILVSQIPQTAPGEVSTLVADEAQSEAVKPVIEVGFGEKESSARLGGSVIPIAAKTVKSENGFALPVGNQDGVSLSAASLSELKEGTMVCQFKRSRPQQNITVPEYFITLRGATRTWIGFCFYPNNNKLYLNFRYTGETYNLSTKDNVSPDVWHTVTCTWDGTKVRLYLDGVIQGEQDQGIPALFPSYSRLNLGPFKDPGIVAKPWGVTNIMIGKVLIYGKAFDMETIMKQAAR